jgi:hypothetical protein
MVVAADLKLEEKKKKNLTRKYSETLILCLCFLLLHDFKHVLKDPDQIHVKTAL